MLTIGRYKKELQSNSKKQRIMISFLKKISLTNKLLDKLRSPIIKLRKEETGKKQWLVVLGYIINVHYLFNSNFFFFEFLKLSLNSPLNSIVLLIAKYNQKLS